MTTKIRQISIDKAVASFVGDKEAENFQHEVGLVYPLISNISMGQSQRTRIVIQNTSYKLV